MLSAQPPARLGTHPAGHPFMLAERSKRLALRDDLRT